MKKILSLAVLALALSTSIHADELSGLLRVMPGSSENKGVVTLGNRSGAIVATGFVGTARCTSISVGDVLVGPVGTTLTSRMGVSRTATAGDINVIGVAATSANFGVTLTVVTYGLTRVNVPDTVTPTVGLRYATSATEGKVALTSALTAGLYTGISGTPTIVTAAETRPVGVTTFLGWVDKR